VSAYSFAQKESKKPKALKEANDFVFEGNKLLNEDDFVSAEMAYRKALSEIPESVAGSYNLGNAYYKKGNFNEALYRHIQAAETAISKTEKHKAFHNIGNILMQNKQCKEAVEAFKNALRNIPTDDETRYNLAIAKECAEKQQDQQDNKDKQDENKENEDNKDKEGDNKEDKKDQGGKDKKEGEDEKDEEGKPKDEKEDNGQGDKEQKKDKQKPKPQQSQLSPQQIKNLLEAMNNQEQKVQEKINAKKQKGVKIKNEKDW